MEGKNDSIVGGEARKVPAIGGVCSSSALTVESTNASIIGVENGDPHCHEPDKATWRSAFHGLVRAIVQSREPGATGNVVIEARANSLASSQIVLEAVAVLPLKLDDEEWTPATSTKAAAYAHTC